MTIAERIRGDIEARIASGKWPPGFRIPFEHELVDEYGCARATVGKALTALVDAGLIERRRKAGSFVAYPHIQTAMLAIPDLAAAISERTGDYRFELMSSGREAAAHRDPDFPEGTSLLHLTGIHHGKDGPVAFEDRRINVDEVPAALQADFTNQPPSSWLVNSVPWTEARHLISAVGADSRIASCLAVSKHTPCLMVDRWTWRAGSPITAVKHTFRGDRFDLVATFTPERR